MTKPMEPGKEYQARVKTTKALILGTYERVTARSEIAYFFLNEEKALFSGNPVGYEHEGGTEIFWDGMETVTKDGKVVFLCEDGEEWTADEIEFFDPDEEDEEP